MFFKEILLAGAGSFVGGALRYVVSKFLNDGFPWGTMLVNVAGCLLMGLFYGLIERGNLGSPEVRLLLIAGFCGGFTTFSAFINENFLMLKSGEALLFILYTAGSIVLGLAAMWLGYLFLKAV